MAFVIVDRCWNDQFVRVPVNILAMRMATLFPQRWIPAIDYNPTIDDDNNVSISTLYDGSTIYSYINKYVLLLWFQVYYDVVPVLEHFLVQKQYRW